MRTTVRIDDHLLESARRRARNRGLSLGELFEVALRRELSQERAVEESPLIPVFCGGDGPRPGIDLNSNRALLEYLDEGGDLERLR
jgi:hypothetical protein